jgi:hypothetical protein
MRASVAGVATFAAVFSIAVVTAGAARAESGSAVIVSAREQDADYASSPFPTLEVRVSQTENLGAQAIRVSWRGAAASTLPNSQNGGENYLQLMQCWGDTVEGGVVGPDRTTCQFGGTNAEGARRDRNVDSAAAIAPADRQYSVTDADVPYTGIPFVSAMADPQTGRNDVVARVANGAIVPGVDLNNNKYFTQYTTNEIAWAGSGADGTGSITFETQTVMQSPGLGCGSPLTDADGKVSGTSCWLVVVPRGAGINKDSPLFWDEWKHRLAVRLDFQPVGQHCAIGAGEQQLAGTELVADVVSSWQPRLCGVEGGNAYTLITTTDSDAAAAANTQPDAPLALTSDALDATSGATDSLIYAPVALTSLAVTFAVDRYPSDAASPEEQALARQPFTSMKLTPRLVAKLITSSYTDALPTNSDKAHLGQNPKNLLFDPEFRELNPDWANQAIISPAVSDILVPQGRSGYARALWDYIAADAEASGFLAGDPDPWGMRVNPWASTDAERHPNGTPLAVPRDDFPKVDPAEAYAGEPRALNTVTWRPYTNDLAAGAYDTLRGDGLNIGEWDPVSIPAKWQRKPRDLAGERKLIALTDGSSAQRYQTVTASLRNPAGVFVDPTTDSMTAAAAAMTADAAQPQVYGFDPASSSAREASSAYPLTLPVYAATNPLLASDAVRQSYVQFIQYAVSDGQEPGDAYGELPAGYAPLPESWRDRALVAAAAIAAAGQQPAPTAPAAPAPAAAVKPASAAIPAAIPAAAAPAPDPAATGSVAAALSAGATPDDPDNGAIASALPLSTLAGALAAGAVPFVGRLRRRP